MFDHDLNSKNSKWHEKKRISTESAVYFMHGGDKTFELAITSIDDCVVTNSDWASRNNKCSNGNWNNTQKRLVLINWYFASNYSSKSGITSDGESGQQDCFFNKTQRRAQSGAGGPEKSYDRMRKLQTKYTMSKKKIFCLECEVKLMLYLLKEVQK